MSQESVLILDFGAQYSQLIARRVRECQVFSEILPFDTPISEIKQRQPKGIILSGGPASVYGDKTPQLDKEIFDLGIPVLGICYGMQLMTHQLAGEVCSAKQREYGKTQITVVDHQDLFAGLGSTITTWMSHSDHVKKPAPGFTILAQTNHSPVAAVANREKQLFGVQFHPEVVHTPQGKEIIHNFVRRICDCSGDWTMEAFVETSVNKIREQVGEGTVICGLSGGIDSSVAAVLVHKAIGDQLTCIYVDHGFMRKGESKQVVDTFKHQFAMNLIHVDAQDRFLGKLDQITDPEQKRKIIGNEFIWLFQEEAGKLGNAQYLVQGTLYPDVIESGTAHAAVIKSHHNVGGLPEDMELDLIEPLRSLFKDEVRLLAEELGLPQEIVGRHPFPGPGLAIRVIGAVTREKLDLLREVDAIYLEELWKHDLYDKIWQAFAVLTNTRTVGVMGDGRTYDYVVALRGVTSHDGMTADWARIPYEVLEEISSRIMNEVAGVNRVVYDISSKPPATIEWE